HAEHRRRRALHDFDRIHRGEYRARMPLQIDALHAAEIGVCRHIAYVDPALNAEAWRRERTRYAAHELLDGIERAQIELFLADERHRTWRLEQGFRETERRGARFVRQCAQRIFGDLNVAELGDVRGFGVGRLRSLRS